MIVLLQRVARASVDVVDGGEPSGVRRTGEVALGFLALVCAEPGDGEEAVKKLARKTAKLRVFEDDAGKMNRSVTDVGGRVLAVSQFTLAADCMNGNRPSFSGAAGPEEGSAGFRAYVEALRAEGVEVETGEFGAHMRVELLNDGPATFWLRVPPAA